MRRRGGARDENTWKIIIMINNRPYRFRKKIPFVVRHNAVLYTTRAVFYNTSVRRDFFLFIRRYKRFSSYFLFSSTFRTCRRRLRTRTIDFQTTRLKDYQPSTNTSRELARISVFPEQRQRRRGCERRFRLGDVRNVCGRLVMRFSNCKRLATGM